MPTKSQIHRKVQILSALVEARQNILAKVSALSEAQRDYIFLGIWSIKDLLAHLAGWDYTNLEAVKEILAAKLPTFYARYDHDWKTYNAMLVAKYKPDSFEELIALIKRSQRELIDLLETLPPEAFNKDFGVRFRGNKLTIRRLLEAELKDEQVHLQQLVDFFKEAK